MRLRRMSMLSSIHRSSWLALILVAGGVMGCAHSKKGQFADVTDRQRGEATTAAPVVVDQPQPAPPQRPTTTTTPVQTDIAATRAAAVPAVGMAATAPAGAAVAGGHQI